MTVFDSEKQIQFGLEYMLSWLLLAENLFQLFPVVILKGLLLTNNFVIGHHSLRMDEHYYTVICVFLKKTGSNVFGSNVIFVVYLNALFDICAFGISN